VRTRYAIAAAVVAAAVAVLAGAVALSGGENDGGGTLSWASEPRITTPRTLPRDRVLVSRVRNDTLEDVDLIAADVRIVDADGHALQSTARFLSAYAHGLFPPLQRPTTPAEAEQRQLGEIVTLRPGESAPVTLSWRVPEGGEPPVRADFGVASLDLP
jgi:hypothetical protein